MTEACLINVFQLKKRVPQGLKPAFLNTAIGTAKAVPFPKPIHQKRSGIFDGEFSTSIRFADHCTHPVL
jgi:hypothetical protein